MRCIALHTFDRNRNEIAMKSDTPISICLYIEPDKLSHSTFHFILCLAKHYDTINYINWDKMAKRWKILLFFVEECKKEIGERRRNNQLWMQSNKVNEKNIHLEKIWKKNQIKLFALKMQNEKKSIKSYNVLQYM